MKVIHACEKLRRSRKWLKVKESSESACREEKWQQGIIKDGFFNAENI